MNTQKQKDTSEKLFFLYEKYMKEIDWKYMLLKDYVKWKYNFLIAKRIKSLVIHLDRVDKQRRLSIYKKYSYRMKE